MLDKKFVPPAYTSFAIVVPPAYTSFAIVVPPAWTSPAMFVIFLASLAWPSSTIAMKCQLVPVLQYLIKFSCPSLTHLCSNWYTQAGTSFTILQTLAWPSFTYIGQRRLVPLLQGKVHVLCTTFTRVFDWTMWHGNNWCNGKCIHQALEIFGVSQSTDSRTDTNRIALTLYVPFIIARR